jgi:serine phosphatase RsbU (regulator of sigma subunit)
MRDRSHEKFQLQLKQALDKTTLEVLRQKEEIEQKNKDITDSIRYAKRIQDAVLPDFKTLNKYVSDSFLFFKPRDIVSGDFYWFNVFGDYLILVCADATGHGVPGAFMSIIGSTLLKDITSKEEIQSPANALTMLEEEIRNLLHQEERDQLDEVDIIICEINLKTHFMRIASTKRSAIISRSNELIVVKKEFTENNQHVTQDIQLAKGDILYLYTDGYGDQFGGKDGKKMKTANIKKLLEQIQKLPMDQQEKMINQYFYNWKGDQVQIDDALFMGLKL